MAKDQLAAFLFATLLASAALLSAAFGSLYSVYARFITESASICIAIRWICYAITATVLVISITNVIIIACLSPAIDGISWSIKYVLYLVTAMINLTPITVSWRMFRDGQA